MKSENEFVARERQKGRFVVHLPADSYNVEGHGLQDVVFLYAIPVLIGAVRIGLSALWYALPGIRDVVELAGTFAYC